MSAWTDHVIDSHLIKAIFGEHCPSLTNVNLHEVTLHRDDPTLLLRFDLDLSELPADPPKKWVTQRANTVQLLLKALDVRELSIIGATTTMTATVTLTSEKLAVDDEDTNLHTTHVDAAQQQNTIRLRVTGDTCDINCLANFVYVDRISAYKQDPSGACW